MDNIYIFSFNVSIEKLKISGVFGQYTATIFYKDKIFVLVMLAHWPEK